MTLDPKQDHDYKRASKLKDLGNERLLVHDYNHAVEKYSEALTLLEDSKETSAVLTLCAILLSNRAQAYIKTEAYGLAVADAGLAIVRDATYAKGYYRRGTAEFALNKPKAARKDFRMVCKLRPQDRDARAKLQECEKACREAAFAAAIESDETVPLSCTLDLAKIPIEASYDGPHPSKDEAGVSLGSPLDNIEDEKMLFTPGMLPMEFAMVRIVFVICLTSIVVCYEHIQVCLFVALFALINYC